MRIAINAAFLGKRRTGVGNYVIGLARCLSDLGHEVVVFSASDPIPTGQDIRTVKTPRFLAFDSPSPARHLRVLWNQLVLPFKILRKRYDIVISQNAEGSIWSTVPQVLVIHDLIPLLYPAEAPRLHSYYKRILPRVIKRATAVVAVSQHTRTDLVERYKLEAARIHVVYNGLNMHSPTGQTEHRPRGLRDGRYFLFVGTFAPRKNLETVTRALAKVRDEIPESLVVVAYPDRWFSDYRKLIEELGISDRVIQLTALTDDELDYIYRKATALFLLSEYEGFGFPPLEAMLAGTPAVVSDSTAFKEIVGDGALRIKAHDIGSVADAMRSLSTDEQLRRRLQRAGAAKAGNYTWSNTADAFSVILSEVAGARSKAVNVPELSR